MIEEIIDEELQKQQWMKDVLHESVAEVIFTKKDGTERVMKCTLKAELLPTVEVKESDETKPARAKPSDSLAVFDVEAQAWRSFRYDSVKEFTIELE
jgi:hypothetical protein